MGTKTSGWRGDPEGHSRAGKRGASVSKGNFKYHPDIAAKAGKIGGKNSPSNFKNNPKRAQEAARKSVESRRLKKLAM